MVVAQTLLALFASLVAAGVVTTLTALLGVTDVWVMTRRLLGRRPRFGRLSSTRAAVWLTALGLVAAGTAFPAALTVAGLAPCFVGVFPHSVLGAVGYGAIVAWLVTAAYTAAGLLGRGDVRRWLVLVGTVLAFSAVLGTLLGLLAPLFDPGPAVACPPLLP